MLSKMVWNYHQAIQSGLFIQICHQIALPLKLDNVTGFFDLFELFLKHDLIITWSRRFLLKWGFLFFIFLISYFLRNMFFYNLIKNIFKSCTSSHSRHNITNIQFKLVTIILFEIGILVSSVQNFQILFEE